MVLPRCGGWASPQMENATLAQQMATTEIATRDYLQFPRNQHFGAQTTGDGSMVGQRPLRWNNDDCSTATDHSQLLDPFHDLSVKSFMNVQLIINSRYFHDHFLDLLLATRNASNPFHGAMRHSLLWNLLVVSRIFSGILSTM